MECEKRAYIWAKYIGSYLDLQINTLIKKSFPFCLQIVHFCIWKMCVFRQSLLSASVLIDILPIWTIGHENLSGSSRPFWSLWNQNCWNKCTERHQLGASNREQLELAVNRLKSKRKSWWRHQMKTFSALLALRVENSPVTGEFPSQRPVTRSFDVLFDLRLNKQLSKQSRSLWRHCNVFYIMIQYNRWYPDFLEITQCPFRT